MRNYLDVNPKYSALEVKGVNENNDCVPRSLATAFGVSLRTAYKLAEDHMGREAKRGVTTVRIRESFEKGNFNEISGKKFAVTCTGSCSLNFIPNQIALGARNSTFAAFAHD